MKKNWRPPDWKCPYKPDGDKDELYCDIGARDQGIFEAGANALLKALKPLILEIAPSSKLVDILYGGE